MNILVINCGSSSIKFALLEADGTTNQPWLSGLLERIGEAESCLHLTTSANPRKATQAVAASDHREAFKHIFSALESCDANSGFQAIGHRVVHGGSVFSKATRIDESVISAVRDLIPLAPIHNPVNLLGIEICQARFPGLPQVAVFDTAFHQTLPDYAYRYAVPESWYADWGVRRYGFHGTAHQYLSEQASAFLGKPANLITLHLGNGASACAIRQGICIDTSMGFTPLEGLIMGTRCGDLDPAAAMLAARHLGVDQAEAVLLHNSGLKGLCGTNDLRNIVDQAESGTKASRLALETYCYRIRKYIGCYFAVLGTVDALVFSGGVGENSGVVRELVCRNLEGVGIRLDPARNQTPAAGSVAPIGATDSEMQVLVIRANEELAIARQAAMALAGRNSMQA
jgi:acetate kinase